MDTSLIWNGAAWQWVPIDLSDYGYVEKEYYVSGRAKVYQAVPYSDYQTQVLRSGPRGGVVAKSKELMTPGT